MQIVLVMIYLRSGYQHHQQGITSEKMAVFLFCLSNKIKLHLAIRTEKINVTAESSCSL